MEKQLLNEAMKELFIITLPQMENEQPAEIDEEARRVYQFAFEAFERGFMYGLEAGTRESDEMKGA